MTRPGANQRLGPPLVPRSRPTARATAGDDVRRSRVGASVESIAAANVGGDHLVTTAAALFRERGYAATTTRDLARALGIQSASLYYHIGKKEDLLYTICIESLRNIRREAEAAVRQAKTPDEAVRLLIQSHVMCALGERDQHAVMLFELRHLSAERAATILALRDGYEALVRRVLSDARKVGTLRSDLTPKLLSLTLLNLLNWTIFWYRAAGRLRPKDVAELLTTVFISGAGTPRSRSSDRRRVAAPRQRRKVP